MRKKNNMEINDIDKIAQGRVWMGIDAKEKGLVDEIGGLYDAIQHASDFSISDLYNILPAGFFIAGLVIIGLILLWIVMGFANAMSCGWQATC